MVTHHGNAPCAPVCMYVPQAQLYTLFQQYQELASSCSEVARERDRLKTDVQLLREELQR